MFLRLCYCNSRWLFLRVLRKPCSCRVDSPETAWFLLPDSSLEYSSDGVFAFLQNFLTVGSPKSARCDDLEVLKKRKCLQVENPRGKIIINQNTPVTVRNDGPVKLKPEQITQIQPQNLTLKLRSGKDFLPFSSWNPEICDRCYMLGFWGGRNRFSVRSQLLFFFLCFRWTANL